MDVMYFSADFSAVCAEAGCGDGVELEGARGAVQGSDCGGGGGQLDLVGGGLGGWIIRKLALLFSVEKNEWILPPKKQMSLCDCARFCMMFL